MSRCSDRRLNVQIEIEFPGFGARQGPLIDRQAWNHGGNPGEDGHIVWGSLAHAWQRLAAPDAW